MASELPFKLNNKDIFRDNCLVNGEWVEAQSKKRFDVVDPGTGKTWATAPDNGPEDVDQTVKAAQTAFESYRKVNPRTRAQWLLKWDALIREHRDDIAKIVTYETGKPIAESQGELDYALGFTW
ncbi:unnamed protein product [Aureobasidium uvarum]|uniref:Aldehyde dehydrogenase domain-containing protein n=1 Tax=Aureobasidium uvarum TaxID=2773716 RepID=A0A9N8PR18_9PEZI|nr:unnamed protein product [Aureobasidium uvarum]